jgi:hypothetical protein
MVSIALSFDVHRRVLCAFLREQRGADTFILLFTGFLESSKKPWDWITGFSGKHRRSVEVDREVGRGPRRFIYSNLAPTKSAFS